MAFVSAQRGSPQTTDRSMHALHSARFTCGLNTQLWRPSGRRSVHQPSCDEAQAGAAGAEAPSKHLPKEPAVRAMERRQPCCCCSTLAYVKLLLQCYA